MIWIILLKKQDFLIAATLYGHIKKARNYAETRTYEEQGGYVIERNYEKLGGFSCVLGELRTRLGERRFIFR